MRTDKNGRRVSDLNGPSAPPPPEVKDTAPRTVHGFVFEPNGQRWDSRAMISVPAFRCAELSAELISHGPHWSAEICASRGTGDTAEEAFANAYRILDDRQTRLCRILNAIHERSGLTTSECDNGTP